MPVAETLTLDRLLREEMGIAPAAVIVNAVHPDRFSDRQARSIERALRDTDSQSARAALRAVYDYSKGVPRLINAVCDKALLCGFVEGRDDLGWRQLRRAIRDLEGSPA